MNLNEINDIKDLPPLIAYLDAIGVLARGEKEHIQKAKAIYRKVYKRLHRRKQREKKKEYTVALNQEDHEFIQAQAAHFDLPISVVLRNAALAYFRQEFYSPHDEQIDQIELTLTKIYSFAKRGGATSETLNAIEAVEGRFQKQLRNPDQLLNHIADLIEENDDFRRKLQHLIRREQ